MQNMNPPNSIKRSVLPKGAINYLTTPVRQFLAIESVSGIFLIICTVIALILANSPLEGSVHEFWNTTVQLNIAEWTFKLTLHHIVNDGLRTLFFFVIGLEIKRELVIGELSTLQKAALPVIAALGGMLAPAGIYLALQWNQPGERGWGVPMATDIAFVVGVLALFGKRVPVGLKVFLLSLAIADDVGAILVIAIAYSGSPDWFAFGFAAAGLLLCFLFNRLGVRTIFIYFAIGVGIWFAMFNSGIHPTIAGVLLGLLTPASAWVGQARLKDALSTTLGRVSGSKANSHDFQHLESAVREATSPLDRLQSALHSWVGYVIMPLFALANAGVHIQIGDMRSPVGIAIVCGLVLGKPIGIFGLSFLAVKLRIAKLPTGVNWKLLAAAGCLGGIGFTMSLFIAELAFIDAKMLDAGKFGIIIGSVLSAVIGCVFLALGLKTGKQVRE